MASDSHQVHNDGRTVQPSTRCQVAGSRGRLFFNLGFFNNASLLRFQEVALPLDDLERTRFLVVNLLSANHMDLTSDPAYSPAAVVVQAGIIQVKNGVFTAVMLGQSAASRIGNSYVQRFRIGVPHGFGDIVE